MSKMSSGSPLVHNKGYARLSTGGAGGDPQASNQPIAISRTSSPQPLPPDDHYAYSTTLRRHEPEPTILDFGHLPHGHGHHNDNLSRSTGRDSFLNASTSSNGHVNHSSTGPGGHSHHPFAHTASPMTPSAHHATQTIQQTVSALATSATAGLASHTVPAIRQMSGPNEFEVGAKDPLWKRFGGQFGDPLIMLLLGSAAVSLLVGNYDDAASIVAAILIVVTGKHTTSRGRGPALGGCGDLSGAPLPGASARS